MAEGSETVMGASRVWVWGRTVTLIVVVALVVCLFLTMALPGAGAAESADPWAGAVALDVADGEYLVDVSLAGGTGRASIASPATLTVSEGKGVLTIVWSSPNYDYMIVNGARYLATVEDGASRFQIPLPAIDTPFEVIADTTAMSQPHEITYEITAAGSSIRAGQVDAAAIATPLLVAVGCGVVAAFYLRRMHRPAGDTG